jgi:hypothetical protein
MINNFKPMKMLFTICIIVVFFACHSKTINQEKNKALQNLNSNSVDKDSIKDLRNECVRGQAEPIFKNQIKFKTTFLLLPDSLHAIETAYFKNGDKLIISNEGCEYYTLIFRFETNRFLADTANSLYWYNKVIILLTEISNGIDAPLDIKNGLDKLNSFVKSNKETNYINLKYEAKIEYGDSEIGDMVSLNSVKKITENKIAITISFSKGPL